MVAWLKKLLRRLRPEGKRRQYWILYKIMIGKFCFVFSSSRNLKLEAGGFSTSPNAGYRQQHPRSTDNSTTPPVRGSGNSTGSGLPTSLLQQLTAISKLLSSQQTVRVDQITTLLNEKVSQTSEHVLSFSHFHFMKGGRWNLSVGSEPQYATDIGGRVQEPPT